MRSPATPRRGSSTSVSPEVFLPWHRPGAGVRWRGARRRAAPRPTLRRRPGCRIRVYPGPARLRKVPRAPHPRGQSCTDHALPSGPSRRRRWLAAVQDGGIARSADLPPVTERSRSCGRHGAYTADGHRGLGVSERTAQRASPIRAHGAPPPDRQIARPVRRCDRLGAARPNPVPPPSVATARPPGSGGGSAAWWPGSATVSRLKASDGLLSCAQGADPHCDRDAVRRHETATPLTGTRARLTAWR